MAIIHKNILVQGRVQGVYFRSSAKKEARTYRIKGLAKNLEDGNVYIEAEGEEEDMYEFIKWCRVGPPAATVTAVQMEDGPIKNFTKFEIISKY